MELTRLHMLARALDYSEFEQAVIREVGDKKLICPTCQSDKTHKSEAIVCHNCSTLTEI